jgi:G6PDH family F420-dependent oxidoreductase
MIRPRAGHHAGAETRLHKERSVPEFGYFLSSEELGPKELVRTAQQAEQTGFRSIWISDHFHPWNDNQGESPFVWSVIGGIAATTQLRVTTSVTCPLVRIHPAIIAQAAATSQVLLDGRFNLGIGTGENLNEHILGDHWPGAEQRLAMLEEAVEVIRKLWTGEQVDHQGTYYTVENARIYSLPERPPPILISGFGEKAVGVAARIGDGFVNVAPSADAVQQYVSQGGKGPKQAGVKVCWGPDEAEARKLAHHLWANQFLPGQAAQELPTPAMFAQLSELVSEEMVGEGLAHGPDPERYVQVLREYADAGYDEIYVSQIGRDQAGFLDFYRRELPPRLG